MKGIEAQDEARALAREVSRHVEIMTAEGHWDDDSWWRVLLHKVTKLKSILDRGESCHP